MRFDSFKVGDCIRADDFEPRPDRGACHIEGVVIEVQTEGNAQWPYAHYCVAVFRDVYRGELITREAATRAGQLVRVPMERSFCEWDGRVRLLTVTTEPK